MIKAGVTVAGTVTSPIQGGKGNTEVLAYLMPIAAPATD
jgi:predicted rRNA methylase YqxC with S4 and FtsJ domains